MNFISARSPVARFWRKPIAPSVASASRAKWAIRAILVAMASAALWAQEPTAGEKTRPGSQARTYNAPGATYSGEGQKYQVAPKKAKAVVSSVNLGKRTITVVPTQQGGKFKVADLVANGRVWSEVDQMEMTFAMPAGSEKILLSKPTASAMGKKSISLEELPLHAEIKIEYYPVPRMVLAMTVERVDSKQ